MSRLDELISTLCPVGFEYRTIGSCVSKVEDIRWDKSVGRKYKYIDLSSVDRDTHQISDAQIIDSETAPSRAQQIVRENDVLLGATRPLLKRYCSVPAEYDGEICSTGFCVLRAEPSTVLPRYLYHVVSSTDFFIHVEKFQKGASYPSISDADAKAFRFPLPPMEVQCEIVKILDNFSEITTELSSELMSELTARKKQYEYYRDNLLTFEADVEWATIEECTEKTQSIRWKDDNGTYEYIDLSSVNRELSTISETTTINAESAPSRAQQIVRTDDILFGTTRPLLKRYCMVPLQYDGQIASTGFCVLRAKKEKVIPRFLYYVISTNAFYKYIEPLQIEGSYPSVTNSNVKSYTMPLPTISVQERIVRVLDNFEAICNDLKIGLPAEIEARQKQYEFYRDLLLSFPVSSQNVKVERERERERESRSRA